MHNALPYPAYGGPDFVNECRYALLKYLQAYNLTPPAHTALVVYTDSPNAFADFEPFLQRLSVRRLTKETVQQWKGTTGFAQRVKVELIADFLQTFNGNVLYSDTDTYITAPIEPVFEDIRRGDFYLHQYEGVIDKTYYPAFQRLEALLSSTPLHYNNKPVQFSKKLKLFNAGVVGLNSSHKYLLQDVLALTDAVYAKKPKDIAAQFAFSYCWQKAGTVKTANQRIAHYRDLKEFRRLLQTFFAANTEESIPNLIKKLHYIDATAIQKDKNAFERLPFFQKIGRRLSGKAWKIAHYQKRL